jgi:Ca2+-binding RTX toxin-like protein
MPGADGTDAQTGSSGDDILSTLGPDVLATVFTLVIAEPVDPATAQAMLDANPLPVANAVLPTYDSSGNEVIPATTPAQEPIGSSNGALDQTGTPWMVNALAVVEPGQADISGGDGDDTLQGSSFDDTMHGGGGDDSIQGGSAFDDINGNKGNDTVDGGSGGSDWLLGGQGDDSIAAHHGDNLILGNLGNDTLYAGDGQDVLRGGQGDDVILGGAGHDFISGDLGNDTETGGAGPTLFHGSQSIGSDVVTNFNYAKGDRVELDPGTTYNVRQVGADTVIDMGGGNQMVLENVQVSTLHSDWLFEGALTHV